MVSNASEDLPEPERPVITVSESRGIATSTFFRLCSRAPRTWMEPAIDPCCPFWAIAYVLLMFPGLCHFPGGDGRSVNRWPVGWAWGRFPASGKDWCDGRQRQQGDPRGKPGQGPGGKKHAGRQQDRQSDPGDKRNLERSGVRG